jgi:hypothetical protein
MNDLVPEDEEVGTSLVNKGGRPKGSKNKITLLKLMAEETFRTGEIDRMMQVCREIVTDALAGDRDCRKLVWQAVVSKSGNDNTTQVGAMPEIIIRSEHPPIIRQTVEAEFKEITNEHDHQTELRLGPDGSGRGQAEPEREVAVRQRAGNRKRGRPQGQRKPASELEISSGNG